MVSYFFIKINKGQHAHLIEMHKHVVEKVDKQNNPRNLNTQEIYMLHKNWTDFIIDRFTSSQWIQQTFSLKILQHESIFLKFGLILY